MLIVLALGGNALLKKGEPLEADIQKDNIVRAARSIAEIAGDHILVITHGNGPQVGLLALQGESYKSVRPYPLDILDAESAGMLGYQLAQQLLNAMPEREVVALLTQVLVDGNDRAFKQPTKPIGPVYKKSDKQRLADQAGWTMVEVDGGLRRVVPSPEPQRILELPSIKLLTEHGVMVVCAGGGGIPVLMDHQGKLQGVAAVVDKDLTSAVLATELRADRLLLLTDVDAVYADWGADTARPMNRATIGELAQQHFEAGTMGPKIAAACRFVAAGAARGGGVSAHIGNLDNIADIVAGRGGTVIIAG